MWCGSRFYMLTWNINKYLRGKMCMCHRKFKTSLGTLHNNIYFLPPNIIPNRSVLLSLPGFNTRIDLHISISSNLSPMLKPRMGILYYLVQLVSLIYDFLQTVMRGIQLIFIFMPLILLYPVTVINHKSKYIWCKMLLIGIGLSGPIIIKLGQWASTRRDLFSEELCSTLSQLQRKTPPHSWYYTKKCFEYAYGSNWQDVFVEFDNGGQPIGSGCCAQVYKAWINTEKIPYASYKYEVSENLLVEALEMLGLGFFSSYSWKTEGHHEKRHLIPVAVKIRHPQMERKLRQDLNILKFLARIITWLLPRCKWLSLIECVDEFSQVMKSQVDFYIEAENLKIFADNFQNSSSVKFPYPLKSLTRQNILVESFEDGCNIDDFIGFGVSDKTRKYLALTGVNTVLQMVFYDNFIHGDMHPGNILVQKKNVTKNFWQRSFPFSISHEEPYSLVILDCGIISTLDERGKKCMKDVFSAVAYSNGERVAELFLQHSNHQCTDVQSFKVDMKNLIDKALSNRVTLHQVDVADLMNSLFSTMIHHKVKVDSSFSSVILAIMVIEGLGRTLDPTMDILERAKPFLVM